VLESEKGTKSDRGLWLAYTHGSKDSTTTNMIREKEKRGYGALIGVRGKKSTKGSLGCTFGFSGSGGNRVSLPNHGPRPCGAKGLITCQHVGRKMKGKKGAVNVTGEGGRKRLKTSKFGAKDPWLHGSGLYYARWKPGRFWL